MDLVKKNVVSIVCGVVAILAVCALFIYPTPKWSSDLENDLNTSKKNYADKIETLINKTPRILPQVPDVNNPNAEPVKLTVFPTKDIIGQGDTFRAAVTQQSQKMLDAAIERNRHTPIVRFSATNFDSFPFKNAYDRWLALPDATIDDPKAPTIKTVLQATLPPNADEVKAEKDRIWIEQFKDRVYLANGVEQNRQAVDQDFERATTNLEDEMRRKRAENFKMYLEPGALTTSHWFLPKEGHPATAEQAWYAQNMLWIDQDVADAIARINQNSKNIMDSPVKQLIKIQIDEDFSQYQVMRASGSTATAGPDAPPPPADDNAMKGQAYTMSETGRVSNPLYDVIQFELELNVDARKIPMILSQLQRGNLLTVYRMDAQVVDARSAVEEGGYVYGKEPVAHLWLKCEQQFMRGWTVTKENPLMPLAVQQRLGIVAPVAQ